MAKTTGEAIIKAGMECAVVKPESIDGASKTEAFVIGEGATVLIVCLPFLKGVNGFPLARYMADLDDLFKEGKGRRSFADKMDRLT